MSTKPVVPTQSRPELKQPAPTKPSPFDNFVKQMDAVLVEKDKTKDYSHTGNISAMLNGAEEQLKKVRHYIQTNEPEKVKKHLVHLANYAFLASTK